MELSLNDTAGTEPEDTGCPVFEGHIYFIIDAVAFVTSSISLLSCCVAVFFIILLKWWTVFNQRLVLYLFLANLIGLITGFLSRLARYGFCPYGGFAVQVSGWMVINANICITATLLLRVFFITSLEKRWDVPTIVFIFLTPFLFNWIPFINHTYGIAGPVCWIKFREDVNGTCEVNVLGEVLQLVLWYVPLYLILTVMILLYFAILVKFWHHRKKWMNFNDNVDIERTQALNYLVSLLVYPTIYFAINIISLVTRIYGFTNLAKPSPELWLLNLLILPLQGACVTVVFLVSVYKKLTLSNLKAALGEWRHKTSVQEYEVKTVKERSMSVGQLLSSYSLYGRRIQ